MAEVLGQVKACLEEQFRPVLVTGEVADLRQPRGGHVYLTLRDATARVRVVVFADATPGLRGPLADGDEVLVWGRITAWPKSGDVQLVADRVEPVGAGAMQARRDRLRKALAAEGLFDPARKKRPPFLPAAVGIVTSPTGAALRDVLTTFERRFPVRVVLAPVRVNGVEACFEVADQLARLDRLGVVDVILVVRGGGSAEDLAAFDAEVVVRAIAACRTPVITGIGHETDTTLADLVADRRAPTPTAAAELAIPVRRELELELARRAQRLRAAATQRLALARRRVEQAARTAGMAAPRVHARALRERLTDAARRLALVAPRARVRRWREQLAAAEPRLARLAAEVHARRAAALAEAERRLARAHPAALVAARAARVDALEHRLTRAHPAAQVAARAARVDALEHRLTRAHPGPAVAAAADGLAALARRLALRSPAPAIAAAARGVALRGDRLERAAAALLARLHGAIATSAGRLASLSPLEVLARGYSLTQKDGAVVRDASTLAPGDLVRTRLARGAFEARVERVDI